MSPSLDLETPSAIPNPQWKRKMCWRWHPSCTQMCKIWGHFRTSTFVLQTRSWALGAGPELCELGAVITGFCHCVVVYTRMALKYNWALFISLIIWSGLANSQGFNSGAEKQKTCKCALSPGRLQWFVNLGHRYLLLVLHKRICNCRVQLQRLVCAPYIILGFMEKLNSPVHAEEIPKWAYWQTCLGS